MLGARDSRPAHYRVSCGLADRTVEAGRRTDLSSEPGVDFVVDVSAWTDRKAAALKAHRSQHISIDRCFFSQPDVDRILSVEVFRQARGPDLTRRPADDVFEGIAGV